MRKVDDKERAESHQQKAEKAVDYRPPKESKDDVILISAKIPVSTNKKLSLFATDQRRQKQQIIAEAVELYLKDKKIPGF